MFTTIVFLLFVAAAIACAWASRHPVYGVRVFQGLAVIGILNALVFVYFLLTHYLGNPETSLLADLSRGDTPKHEKESILWTADYLMLIPVGLLYAWQESRRFGLGHPWLYSLVTILFGTGPMSPLLMERVLRAEKSEPARPMFTLYWLHTLIVFACLFFWVPNFLLFNNTSLGRAYETPVMAFIVTTVLLMFVQVLTLTLPKTPDRFLKLGTLALGLFWVACLWSIYLLFREWNYQQAKSREASVTK